MKFEKQMEASLVGTIQSLLNEEENKYGNCEGCSKPLGVFDAVGGWNVCMDCTKARHRAAVNNGKCTCGKKAVKRKVSNGIRKWIGCDRCLGSVKQLN